MPKVETITAEVRLRITIATAALAGLISRLFTSRSISFHPSTGFSSPTLSPSYCTAARPGQFTGYQNAGYRPLGTSISEDCSVSPSWSTIPNSTSGT
ncbi:hypothetical protein DPMN_083860 [Dreissena polymorpha]|uniref:Uncharacterized protein n=1 Tax=Dreissena polymorpha TaxID=45954 RepID=A0A9D3YA32_DREPO|nr:hypothetical protein DPMN_083860 [Dreissena polymorpha]